MYSLSTNQLAHLQGLIKHLESSLQMQTFLKCVIVYFHRKKKKHKDRKRKAEDEEQKPDVVGRYTDWTSKLNNPHSKKVRPLINT